MDSQATLLISGQAVAAACHFRQFYVTRTDCWFVSRICVKRATQNAIFTVHMPDKLSYARTILATHGIRAVFRRTLVTSSRYPDDVTGVRSNYDTVRFPLYSGRVIRICCQFPSKLSRLPANYHSRSNGFFHLYRHCNYPCSFKPVTTVIL